MATLSELQAARDALVMARLRGVLAVRDANGETVTYRTDSDMKAAIAAADSEIARLSGRTPKTIIFNTSKGL